MTEQNFATLAKQAENDANMAYFDVVTKHFDALQKPEVATQLYALAGDNPEGEFDRTRTLKRRGNQQKFLAKNLEQVQDFDGLMNVCDQYVEREAQRLFFIHNDRLSANLSRDYFEDFINRLTHQLQASGMVDESQLMQLHALPELFDLYLQSYDCLRKEVEFRSGGKTDSLITLAKSGYEQYKSIGRKRAYKYTPPAASEEDGQGLDAEFFGFTNLVYQDLFADYGLEFDDETPAHPFHIYIASRAGDIAITEAYERFKDLPAGERGAKMAEASGDRTAEIMKQVNEMMARMPDQPNEAYLAVREYFNTATTRAANVPQNMVEITQQAAQKAQTFALQTIGAHANTFAADFPNSARSNWVKVAHKMGSGSTKRIANYVTEITSDLTREKDALSLRTIADRCEAMVDRATELALFGNGEPASVLAVGDFVNAMRKELADALPLSEETTKQLVSLQDVAEKARLGYESCLIAKNWLAQKTKGGYDDYNIRAYSVFFVESGTQYPHLGSEELNDMRAMASDMFTEVVSGRGALPKGYKIASPLLAGVFDRCCELAEYRVRSEHSLPLETPMKRDQQVQMRHLAKELLQGIVEKLPRTDETGEKMQAPRFEASMIAPEIRKMDKEIEALETSLKPRTLH